MKCSFTHCWSNLRKWALWHPLPLYCHVSILCGRNLKIQSGTPFRCPKHNYYFREERQKNGKKKIPWVKSRSTSVRNNAQFPYKQWHNLLTEETRFHTTSSIQTITLSLDIGRQFQGGNIDHLNDKTSVSCWWVLCNYTLSSLFNHQELFKLLILIM